jgi:hypothetical protein
MSVTLTDAEREFLQFAVITINGNRYGINSMDELIQRMNNEGTEKFLQVPLTKGSTASRISTEGLMETMRAKLTALLPSNILKTIQENVEGFIDSSQNSQYNKAKAGE